MALADPAPFDRRRPKLAREVARRIEREILDTKPAIGTVIGSEPDLIARYGTSRAVFREAVRLVEHSGLAATRRGQGGGLIVTEPDGRAVAMALAIWFSYVGVTVDEIFETRAPLQLAAARLAAERIDDAGAERLQTILDELDAMPVADEQALQEFERAVLDVAGNPVLTLLTNGVFEIGLSRVRGTRGRVDPPATAEDSLRHLRAYHRLAEAVTRGDADAAEARMETILRALHDRLRDRPIRARRRPVRITATGGKLAERVAAEMRDDIERGGWKIGTVLGSETELRERYGVSRSTLREAIRILEQHDAVRTKTGPHGGIVVSEPDGDGVLLAVEFMLAYQGATNADIFEVRSVLEVAAVRLAAERHTEEDAARLRAALAAEADAPIGATVHREVHRLLAEGTGNRPLELFVDVLSRLTAMRLPVGARRPAVRDVRTAHADVADAVLRGDADRAERVMTHHLAAVGAALP